MGIIHHSSAGISHGSRKSLAQLLRVTHDNVLLSNLREMIFGVAMYGKIFSGIAIVLVLLAAGWLVQTKGQQHPSNFTPVPPEKAMETYLGLRKMALTAPPARSAMKIGPNDPVVALMDLNTAHRTATIVAYIDGTVSIYLSNGGGFLGGGQSYPSVREAGKKLIATAHRFQPQMHKTQDYPLPQKGEVFFYVVTENGVYTVSAPEAELNRRTHPLTELYAAGQEVITQYRLNTPK